MDRKIIWVGFASFLVIGIAVLFTVVLSKPVTFRGTAYSEPYPPAPLIELQQADGESFHLSDQRGRIVLVFFGYTSCPDVCPATLAEFNAALDQIGEKGQQVQVAFVSVDPERDTPAKIQDYVERFNPTFLGLSGSEAELEPIWNGYGVFREIVQGGTAMNYIVNHTARTTLIDLQGNMRLSYGFQTPPEDIAYDIEHLLSQSP